MKHGQILGGVVATPDLESALGDYATCLGLRLIERGPLPEAIAQSWDCPASAGSPMAVLQPESGAPCYIRLIEQRVPVDFVPTTSFGWASYELTCLDVFAWPERIAGSGFRIIGPPKEIAGLPYFVAMQVHGRGGEMLYFNETRSNTPTSDLPFARSPMDHIFIVILAARDRAATVDWYRERLGLDEGETYTIEYSMINNAFSLPSGTQSSLTMVQNGRMPIVEIDAYPPQTRDRPTETGRLPPGNALVTLAVDSLDALPLDYIIAPFSPPGAVYGGRRAATVRGPSGELLELVETGQGGA